MSKEEKMEVIGEILDLEKPVELDVALDDLEEWDSLARLALIVKVKQLYGNDLTTEDMRAFITVKDIYDYLK